MIQCKGCAKLLKEDEKNDVKCDVCGTIMSHTGHISGHEPVSPPEPVPQHAAPVNVDITPSSDTSDVDKTTSSVSVSPKPKSKPKSKPKPEPKPTPKPVQNKKKTASKKRK